ncbi:DUF2877 domain-containing protein [Allofustis seminis]|uniref:DUF2877 domain-containing protein n=1 Tax=Allofustis seminis TaxID=166939 RepID=UPI0003A68867|nr:DUF2877 domain-containing protein [Allofustis seminis]
MNRSHEVLLTHLVGSTSALKMLNESKSLSVHSVFERGINLTDGTSPELLYIGPNYPGTLVANGIMIDREIFKKLTQQLNAGVRVQFKNNYLIFYTRPQLIIVEIEKIDAVHLYIPKISEADVRAVKLFEKIEAEHVIEKSGFVKNKVWLNILHNILENDKIRLEDVLNLIGAGVGLTPSGDDFLQGAILMETALGHPPKIRCLVQEGLKSRTTTAVSVSYYALLLKQNANLPWQALLEAVSQRDETEVIHQLHIIQTFGHTSGKDILVGAWTYLKMNKIG